MKLFLEKLHADKEETSEQRCVPANEGIFTQSCLLIQKHTSFRLGFCYRPTGEHDVGVASSGWRGGHWKWTPLPKIPPYVATCGIFLLPARRGAESNYTRKLIRPPS